MRLAKLGESNKSLKSKFIGRVELISNDSDERVKQTSPMNESDESNERVRRDELNESSERVGRADPAVRRVVRNLKTKTKNTNCACTVCFDLTFDLQDSKLLLAVNVSHCRWYCGWQELFF